MARRRQREDHNAGLYPPCLECGSTGGARVGSSDGSRRTRGLCNACVKWHTLHGTLGQFRRLTHAELRAIAAARWPEHPTLPTGYISPYQLGCTRDQHAIIPAGWDADAVVAEAERFAAEWLAARDRVAA